MQRTVLLLATLACIGSCAEAANDSDPFSIADLSFMSFANELHGRDLKEAKRWDVDFDAVRNELLREEEKLTMMQAWLSYTKRSLIDCQLEYSSCCLWLEGHGQQCSRTLQEMPEDAATGTTLKQVRHANLDPSPENFDVLIGRIVSARNQNDALLLESVSWLHAEAVCTEALSQCKISRLNIFLRSRVQ